MTVGSLGFAGIFIVLLALYFDHSESVRSYMIRVGGIVGGVFVAVQMVLGYWVFSAQPSVVKEGLVTSPLGYYGMLIWGLFSAAAIAAAFAAAFVRSATGISAWTAAASALLMTAGAVLARDVIRDVTLLSKGFDVWNRAVVSNWSVVIIFLVLFVAALILLAFLLVAVNRSMKEVKSQNA
jgi:hypothetical protein